MTPDTAVSIGEPWMWAAFVGFVLVMLALDLFVFGGRQAHKVGVKEALAVGAVLGLSEKTPSDHGRDKGGGAVASILRLTIGPLVVYAVIAAGMAGIFTAVYA